MALPALAGPQIRVFPLDPPDGAVINARPVFRLGYEEIDETELRGSRFRITLRRDGLRGEELRFDQLASANGWAHGDEGTVLYYPRQPLPDGEYQWTVARWDGTAWSAAPEVFALRIDSVAPADVDGLRIAYDRERARYHLRWRPVTLDRNGAPEFVARYHVYRYDGAPPFPTVRLREIGVATIPELSLDEGDATEAEPAPLLFYRVVAEDEAGNQAGLRR